MSKAFPWRDLPLEIGQKILKSDLDYYEIKALGSIGAFVEATQPEFEAADHTYLNASHLKKILKPPIPEKGFLDKFRDMDVKKRGYILSLWQHAKSMDMKNAKSMDMKNAKNARDSVHRVLIMMSYPQTTCRDVFIQLMKCGFVLQALSLLTNGKHINSIVSRAKYNDIWKDETVYIDEEYVLAEIFSFSEGPSVPLTKDKEKNALIEILKIIREERERAFRNRDERAAFTKREVDSFQHAPWGHYVLSKVVSPERFISYYDEENNKNDFLLVSGRYPSEGPLIWWLIWWK